MQIGEWIDGSFRNITINDVETSLREKTWIDVVDPNLEELESIADEIHVPRNLLIGKLRTNHSHVDAQPNYTKVFAWQLESAKRK